MEFRNEDIFISIFFIIYYKKELKKRFAERSIKQLIQFDSSTESIVPLESTSSPYYEWKRKCKDYH